MDIGDPASILDTPEDNDIASVELPIEANQILDDSLQDAINAAIAVMKDNDDIKVEELMTEFGSPEFRGEKRHSRVISHWINVRQYKPQ